MKRDGADVCAAIETVGLVDDAMDGLADASFILSQSGTL